MNFSLVFATKKTQVVPHFSWEPISLTPSVVSFAVVASRNVES